MKEINIAATLINKRKEKGITQNELAKFMGVSKASVSKWETGQSYPDITFLPQLAAFFNITIDELVSYKPQMQKSDIAKLYHRLSADFAVKPYEDVMNECREIIKKYYSCFPLLLQMGVLILYHSYLAGDTEKSKALILEAKALFVRVKNESADVEIIKKAQYMEANCYIALGDSQSAIELFEAINKPMLIVETVLATAYQMEGKFDDAKTVLQSGIYQYLIGLLSVMCMYLMYIAEDRQQFNEALKRTFIITDIFDVEHLLPSVVTELYMAAAYGYMMQDKTDEAITMLQKFAECITNNACGTTLHGDSFFFMIENWLEELDLGRSLVKNERTMRQGLIEFVLNNPVFSSITEDPRFQNIADKLKNKW